MITLLVIGCGGIGAALCRILSKQYPKMKILAIDPDIIEKRNLQRQEFSTNDLNKPKAEIMRDRKYAKYSRVQSFSRNYISDRPYLCSFCCADNLLARQELLIWSDFNETPCIITGNERYTAEAYIYLPEWKNTRRDPRKYYPELKETAENQQGSCVSVPGEQTVMANSAAATFAVYLFDLYFQTGFWENKKVAKRKFKFRIDRNEVKGTN